MRLLNTAINRGLISSEAAVPKLSTRGQKSNPRPAFTRREIDHLQTFMATWADGGRLTVEREMRPFLRDYVEFLLYTGMRHGTEAIGLRWCDVSWHEADGKRYLRMWVNGKTGGRFIIAKHLALPVLKRLWRRQQAILNIKFKTVFESSLKQPLFALTTGHELPSLNGTFRRLMRDSEMLKSVDEQTRTVYSLRHTYATFELLENSTDIHTLRWQIGSITPMIERHYSKLTATKAAERLA